MTGTAAVGAPIPDGQVSVFDVTGELVASTTTGSDGRYSLDVPSDAQAPLAIKLSFSGQELFAVKASTASGVANINQLTHATTAMLSSNGDPSQIVEQLASGTTTIDQSKIEEKSALLKAAIKPAADAIANLSGDQAVGDFATADFQADGTGLDKLLDTAQVSLVASGGAAANIEVAFNVATNLDNTTEPLAVSFSSVDSQATVVAKANSVTIDSSKLPPNQLGALYDDLLARMNECYTFSLNERMVGGVITPAICKSLFKNSNPALFMDGGYSVSGRFTGLTQSSSPITIYRAQTPVLMHNIVADANGDLSGKALVAVRGVDAEGNYLNTTVVAEVFDLNGSPALGFIGDQNPAEFYVNSEIEVVNHPLAQDTNYDYVTSGYSVYAPNYAPTGKTLILATVTTPKGNVVIFGKRGSRSQLFICKSSELTTSGGQTVPSGDCTGVPTFVQGFRYLDQSLEDAGQSPIELAGIRRNVIYSKTDTSSELARRSCPAFSNLGLACPRSDEEIESQRAGGLWTLTYYYDDNSTLTLRARHPVRALSNRELVAATGPDAKAARLTSATIAKFKALNQAAVTDGRAPANWLTTGQGQNPIWAPSTGGYEFEWTVEAGQEAPRQVYMSGRVAYYLDGSDAQRWWDRPNSSTNLTSTDFRPSFDEKARFKSNVTRYTLECSLADSNDVSCGGVTGTWLSSQASSPPLQDIQQANATKDFAPGVWMSYANLWTKDSNQRNLKRSYNLYYPE